MISKPQISNIQDAKFIQSGEKDELGSGTNSLLILKEILDTVSGKQASSNVLLFEDELRRQTIFNEDFGIYQGAILRFRLNKFGATNQQNILEDINGIISVNETKGDTFGGSCFIQQMQFKQSNPVIAPDFTSVENKGRGYNIISCNYANSNLRLATTSSTNQVFPVTVINFLDWLNTVYFDQQGYSSQYSIQNNIQSRAVFDINLESTSELITRKYYSQINLINSISDQNRIFMPIRFC